MKRVALEKDFNLSFEATRGKDIKAEWQIRTERSIRVMDKKKKFGAVFFF